MGGNTGSASAAVYRGGRREGGSGSGLLTGTQIPTFPLLQVPAIKGTL